MVDNSLIRYIVGASRVKYEVLDEILLKHPDLDAVSTAKHYDMVVMFVDGYSLLYRLYLEKNLTALYADNRAELVRDRVHECSWSLPPVYVHPTAPNERHHLHIQYD